MAARVVTAGDNFTVLDRRAHPASSLWLPQHVAAIADHAEHRIPPIRLADAAPILAGIDLWDMWPLQHADGSTARFDGWTVWFVLSAPAIPDPDLRHGIARIRLLTERDGQWRDCGSALPDGLNPGSREWAGSSLYDAASNRVVLFYTVAGERGEAPVTFAQRLFQTEGRLEIEAGHARITGWTGPHESVCADGVDYMVVNQSEGVPGFIKGFRDPAHFRDPADGRTYLLFTGSLRQSNSDWNGCIGIAGATNEAFTEWDLLPPLLTADGLNNEQERPHVIHRNGLYYLFWSTQRKVFAPGGPNGPNGLYGMVASTLQGPYKPLNGTGLVAANPDETPYQAYSWWVTDELEVAGFVDLPGVAADGQIDDAGWRRDHFGGTPAPRFHLVLDGQHAHVKQSGA